MSVMNWILNENFNFINKSLFLKNKWSCSMIKLNEELLQLIFSSLTDNEIHLYIMSTTNLLILFYVWIKVRRIKRSQFDAVQMMLKHCVIRKVIMQSFHSCNNISSNSHNQSTRKINDMMISVRNEKILLVIRQLRCIVWELWLQVIEEIMTCRLRQYTETSLSHQQCCQVIDEKISDRIVISDDESENWDYMCSKK